MFPQDVPQNHQAPVHGIRAMHQLLQRRRSRRLQGFDTQHSVENAGRAWKLYHARAWPIARPKCETAPKDRFIASRAPSGLALFPGRFHREVDQRAEADEREGDHVGQADERDKERRQLAE